jgi:glucosamine--fructose-6-phosphate aminotransferase (isomerizing)
MSKQTQMSIEAQQAPQLIEEQLTENLSLIQTLVKHIQAKKPPFVMTIARGSSDHAATFAKYLFETKAGLVTASSAPSVTTLYHSRLHLKNALVIAISQSGKSDDLVHMMQLSREEGAITVALVNDIESPLAQAAEHVIPTHAGIEHAVAATKSYLTSLSALIQFIAYYTNDIKLIEALNKLPEQLSVALNVDWSAFIEHFAETSKTFVLGRGYSFPIAQESALKFKETCNLQAEAFSSAEIMHGPFALIEKNYPVLLYAQNDNSHAGTIHVAKRIVELGGDILLATPKNLASPDLAKYMLPLPNSLHPMCVPLVALQAFYPAIAGLAVKRGYDPDKPQNLNKVTRTH